MPKPMLKPAAAIARPRLGVCMLALVALCAAGCSPYALYRKEANNTDTTPPADAMHVAGAEAAPAG